MNGLVGSGLGCASVSRLICCLFLSNCLKNTSDIVFSRHYKIICFLILSQKDISDLSHVLSNKRIFSVSAR